VATHPGPFDPGQPAPAKTPPGASSADSHSRKDGDGSVRICPLAFPRKERTGVDEDLSLQHAIEDHLELKDKNAALEQTMPLEPYRDQPLADQQPGEQPAGDPWSDGLWAAPAALDWGD